MMMLKKEKPVMPISVLIHGNQNAWNQPGSNDIIMSSVGRQSPLDVTSPSSSFTNNGDNASPGIGSTSSSGNSYLVNSSPGSGDISISGSSFSPTHPLSGSKHLCSICGDKASGKHYGVYSCEGCKGFFKRTVRKELVYSCREKKECTIDKRQRNRCQYCRYRKCLSMGMKREAVQEERQRTKMEKIDVPDLSQLNGAISEMPVSQILEAELMSDPDNLMLIDQKPDMSNYFPAAKDQMEQMVMWAKHIPHFTTLPLEDQMVLLKQGWNELLIVTFSHRSVNADGAIILSNGIRVDRSTMQDYGLDAIFDRVLSELVQKMKELQMDKTELGCLKSIVLFNSEAKNLCCTAKVEILREKVYVALEEYTKSTYPDQAGRFPKLLLRMPALRSIGLKCTENLFFLKDWHNYPKIIDTPIDKYLLNLLSEERTQGVNLNS